jgi:hypothetical protein
MFGATADTLLNREEDAVNRGAAGLLSAIEDD